MPKLIALLFVCWSLSGWATEIIPLNEIRPGMVGYGLTVVRGTEISRFEVEVIDVLDEPGERYDFIVVRAFGEAIVRSGGLASGMSGSPIYFEGKLAGALSRAAAWALDRERPLGLVTPIATMLKLLPELEKEKIPVPEDGGLRALGIDRIILVDAEPKEIPQDAIVAWPISVPVMVSGLSERTLSLLRDGVDFSFSKHPLLELLPSWRGKIPGLAALGITQIVSAPTQGADPALDFQPGAPVGVALSFGDLTIGALGTVTLVQNEKILAFGHRFLFTGPCRYFLTEVAVIDTVAAMNLSYKFGTLTDPRGGVFVDRWAGIGGRTDRFPPAITTEIAVKGEASGKLSLQIVDEARLSPLLFYVAGLEAVDSALDRSGPGTVRVRYTISGRALPRSLTRENVFLSTRDVAIYAPLEAALVLDVLAYNPFRDPLFTAVKLEAEVSPEFSAIQIVDLSTDRKSYRPGDTIQFTLTLRHWRGEIKTVEGSLRIPPKLDSPHVELRAYGGPRLREKGELPPPIGNLDDLLDFIERIPTYDTFTVELFAVAPVSEVLDEPWLYGVDFARDRIPGTVVYGRIALILPLRG